MSTKKSSENNTVEAPAIVVHLHKSIQRLPAEARETDPKLKMFEQAVKAIVESETLHQAFKQLNELVPYPLDEDIGPDPLHHSTAARISPDPLDHHKRKKPGTA